MVFRERRQSRHRANDAESSDATPDHELESFLAAISPEADASPSELTGRFGSAQVFQLRLPALRIEQLRRLAESRDVPPTALVMDWVIERLDKEDPSTLAPAPRNEVNPAIQPGAPTLDVPAAVVAEPPGEPMADPVRQPATAALVGPADTDPFAPYVPAEALNQLGGLGPASHRAAADVTPLFRNPPPAHATEERPKGPRHRAPEPVTSLRTRRKF
jgi:hypothetical protein